MEQKLEGMYICRFNCKSKVWCIKMNNMIVLWPVGRGSLLIHNSWSYLYFLRGPCSLCSYFVIYIWTFDFEHYLCSLHAIYFYIKMCSFKLPTKNHNMGAHILILILIWGKFETIKKKRWNGCMSVVNI